MGARKAGAMEKRNVEKISLAGGVAPTALDALVDLFPALTGWANFCRAYGAGRSERSEGLNLYILQKGKTQRMRHPQSRCEARWKLGVRREVGGTRDAPGDRKVKRAGVTPGLPFAKTLLVNSDGIHEKPTGGPPVGSRD
jgi:hypothetical protein